MSLPEIEHLLCMKPSKNEIFSILTGAGVLPSAVLVEVLHDDSLFA